MRHTLRLACSWIALAAAAFPAAGGEEVTVRFQGSPDRPILVRGADDLDGRRPLVSDPTFPKHAVFRLAPGDKVRIEIQPPPGGAFVGKSFSKVVEAVKIESDGGLFGTGILADEEREPTFKTSNPPTTLRLGDSLQVILVLKTYQGVEVERVYLPASRATDYVVPGPVDAYIRLAYRASDVEWTDRGLNAAEQQELKAWGETFRNQGYDEINPKPDQSRIRAGNLAAARIILKADRP